jgi:hypothetical protein
MKTLDADLLEVWERGRYVAIPRAGVVHLKGLILSWLLTTHPEIPKRTLEVVQQYGPEKVHFVGLRILSYPVQVTQKVANADELNPNFKKNKPGELVEGYQLRPNLQLLSRSVDTLVAVQKAMFPRNSVFVACPTCAANLPCTSTHAYFRRLWSEQEWLILLCYKS